MRTMSVSGEVSVAIRANRPVVALESTLIAHGLPFPVNVETALAAEAAIRDVGAIPATIAILEGRPTIGLTTSQIQELAQSSNVLKVSRRDLGYAIANRRTAATTVAATMALAHMAGIRVFATGGIGGVHPDPIAPFDISADLLELARTPVLVVCAGAKNILDLPKTLEVLETQGVPVVGYRTNDFPAFYLRSSGLTLSARAESPHEVAAIFKAHWEFGGGSGMVLAQPITENVALNREFFDTALKQAELLAAQAGIHGPALTPFLLARLAELTSGASLVANQALITANARLAAEIAVALKTDD